jgi:hypothetical protein
MAGHTKSSLSQAAMPIIYDMQGYPHFVVDFAERRPDGARKTVQAAMLLVRSFFDEGEQRMTSIDDIDIGTPANGWTIRFTGVTGAQPPEAYIATYRNGEISYNEDPSRQAASMSERVWYAVDFAKGKGGSKGSGKTKNCTKGKLCGDTCIAKGRNCRIETNATQKKAADALSKTNAEDAAKAKAAVKKEKTGEKAAKQEESLKAISGESASGRKQVEAGLNEWKDLVSQQEQGSDGLYARDVDNIVSAMTFGTYPPSIRAVIDSKGKMQSAAEVEVYDDHIYVNYLATAPWNVGPKGGRDPSTDPRATRGSGREMMRQIVIESFRRGAQGQVRLESLRGAQAFYEKCGFKSTTPSSSSALPKMELSSSSARQFLEQTGGIPSEIRGLI